MARFSGLTVVAVQRTTARCQARAVARFPVAATGQRFLALCLAVCVTGSIAIAQTTAAPQPLAVPAEALATVPVTVPAGFRVTEFANDQLAHDIFCLTIDAYDRVVVSGPGYIKILIDQDGDGVAERAQTFADGPKSGAQGLIFLGRTLLCVGDGALLRYRDQDGDDRADGPPDVLLKLQTGGEHDAHAIQLGPEGWWYLIAGNTARITSAYASLPSSPVKQPRAGTLLRFQPDLKAGEIYADGLRNAYDFAFGALGDVFIYDSDDEREISLPWYRPTRVFQTLPGSDHGWVSKGWKRPNYYLDMPPVVGSFGRGSPTGMACYRHTQFPKSYWGALFALDWTYGRVLCLKVRPQGETWQAESEVFMAGTGGYGFAPTDCEIGADGALYVSVGGRGTRGGVYRVAADRDPVAAEVPGTPLEQTLMAPQPLSSWSRRRWTPVAKSLGADAYRQAARNPSLPATTRVRALEILTELYGGCDAALTAALLKDEAWEVRARAVWSHSRGWTATPLPGGTGTSGGPAGTAAQSALITTQTPAAVDPSLVAAALNDPHPMVVRAGLEAALAVSTKADWLPIANALPKSLGAEGRFNRSLAAAVVGRLPVELLPVVSQGATQAGPTAVIAYAVGWLGHAGAKPEQVRKTMAPLLGTIVAGEYRPDLKLDALRLMMWMLGDVGPSDQHPPAFDSYTPALPLDDLDRDTDILRQQLAEAYPTGHPLVDWELARCLGLLAPLNQPLLDKVLARITADSDPVDDLHHLLVAAQFPVTRSVKQREATAAALVNLDAKFLARQLPQDNAWNDRLKELFAKLVGRDEYLTAVMVDVPGFGRPAHVLFMSQMHPGRVNDAMAAFFKQASGSPDYPWNNDVIFLLGESPLPEHRQLIRGLADRFALRGAVLMTLAEKVAPVDRPRFIAGLETNQPEVLAACLSALEQLPPETAAAEQVALLKGLRRLGQDEREYLARERIVKLLMRNTGIEQPFVFGKAGHQPQAEAIARWTAAVSERYPEAAQALGAGDAELADLPARLAQIDWSAGDRERGARLYQARQCAQCHGGRSALGPDLAGITGRFSKADLFTAILLPSRDVSARYQTTLIETKQGKSYAGMIVYESVDGLLLRNAALQTFRVESREIEERQLSPVSLMPAGLLKDLTPADWADLYAYLTTLGAASGGSTAGQFPPGKAPPGTTPAGTVPPGTLQP